jgi:hypothetical protein
MHFKSSEGHERKTLVRSYARSYSSLQLLKKLLCSFSLRRKNKSNVGLKTPFMERDDEKEVTAAFTPRNNLFLYVH